MFNQNDPQQRRFVRALASGDELAWAVWRESQRELRAIALEVVRDTTEATMQAMDNTRWPNRF